MKIVRIFGAELFSFHYHDEKMNEFRRLLTLWNNTNYLFDFINENRYDIPKVANINDLVIKLTTDANEMDEILYKISKDSKRNLEDFFRPLDNQEYQFVELSKQKGRKNYLRLFAIKIDTNCFVITGGAIKFHHLNKDRDHTQKEMIKIEKCRNYLKSNDVYDSDSFFEFLNEQL